MQAQLLSYSLNSKNNLHIKKIYIDNLKLVIYISSPKISEIFLRCITYRTVNE